MAGEMTPERMLSMALPVSVPIQLKLPSEQKQDVFDQPQFDSIKFINQIYPDESSLTDLERFMEVLKKKIRTLDTEIYQAVRAQGGAHTRAKQDITSAHAQIAELLDKIQGIQKKSEESEMVVQEICRDIKKLDCAKTHLTGSITALRRLAMLTAAVSDLEAASARRDQYKKCANLLEAVHQLMEYFQQYESTPKVKNLSKRVGQVEMGLQEAVIEDFRILMGQADVRLTPDNLDRLASACLVINALGPKVREQLMDWLCDREMAIYQAVFSASNEASKLDRFERRYLWFKSRLDDKKEVWAIFPERWRVPHTLAITFCKITKAQLKRILSEDEATLRQDIGPLIKTVVATGKFEKEMASLFGGGTAALQDQSYDEGLEGGGDSMTASEARKRLEHIRHKAKQEEMRKANDKMTDKERAAQLEARTTFEGSISAAFETSLRYYVDEEEKELVAHLEACVREENEHRWCPSEEDVGTRVLGSANKLFFKIRASLTRCSRMISRGHTMLQLTQVFQRVVGMYSTALMQRLPKTVAGHTSVSPPYVATEWYIKVPEDEEKVVCHIMHTAEFCRETIEGLASAVQKDIKPHLAESVDMSDQENAFINVSSACMSVLVLGINTRLDAALQEMMRIRWDVIEQPGDDSIFVHTLRTTLLDCAPRLGHLLDRTSFSFLCDKMARMFLARYTEGVYRIRRISEKGTLQLSIDCDAVKRILQDFPKAARPNDPDLELPNYHAYVDREMGSVINTVKVLQSKPENLVDTFMLLMPQQAQSQAEFLRVCEMKGLTKPLQQSLLAIYLGKMEGSAGGGAAVHLPSGFSAGASLLSASAASSLGAFKENFSNLASSINFPTKLGGMGGGAQPTHPPGSSPSSGPAMKAVLAASMFSRLGSNRQSQDPREVERSGASIADTMKEKTKEGFAKIGNLFGSVVDRA